MVVAVASVLIAASLGWALWCAGSAVIGQAPTMRHRLGLVVLEVAAILVALAGAVAVLVIGGRPGTAVVEILGYLIAVVVALPIGAGIAQGERTRYGSIVLAVAGVTLAVLVLRTYQVWENTRV